MTKPRTPLRVITLIALVGAITLLSACRTNREAEDQARGGPVLVYERARKALDNQDFENAIRISEALQGSRERISARSGRHLHPRKPHSPAHRLRLLRQGPRGF